MDQPGRKGFAVGIPYFNQNRKRLSVLGMGVDCSRTFGLPVSLAATWEGFANGGGPVLL